MKSTFLKPKLDELASNVKLNADLLIAALVCSVKIYLCCNDMYTSCANDSEDWEQVLSAISQLE